MPKRPRSGFRQMDDSSPFPHFEMLSPRLLSPRYPFSGSCVVDLDEGSDGEGGGGGGGPAISRTVVKQEPGVKHEDQRNGEEEGEDADEDGADEYEDGGDEEEEEVEENLLLCPGA
jgi:hypothetical protein